ncbi:hypothetical protein HDV63DRAFT_389610 [Trichoderma sp. SZMC 28014]
MAIVTDSPVFRELAKILEHIDPFPHPGESNFERCRGFKKDNVGRCRAPLTQKQDRIDSLLSQFRSMTKWVDTKSLHDQMRTFITLTHCKKHHRDEALEAFDKWKRHRKAATSSIRPVTPPRSVTPHDDSFELDSDTNSMSFSSLERDIPDHDQYTLDSHIEDEMKRLKIATSTRHASTQTKDNDIDESGRQKFEILGDVYFPEEGKDYNHGKILQAITGRFSEKSEAGILYILKHTQIPGLFKIGRSKLPESVRHNQNCFKPETDVLYATDEPFFGHSRAERIAHAILWHKRLSILKCVRCNKRHREWFLTTEKEVLDAVELAERFLKMPAYEVRDGVYKLTPKAEDIQKQLFRFSMPKMDELMNKVYGSNDNAHASPVAASAATARGSGASVERAGGRAAQRATPRVVVDESPDIALPPRYKTRAKSPAARTSDKGESPLLETKETFAIHQRRSRETTPDGDGNYKLVTEVEFTRTIRTKVSRSEFHQGCGVYDFLKPAVFGCNGEKERRTEVKVEEVQKV